MSEVPVSIAAPVLSRVISSSPCFRSVDMRERNRLKAIWPYKFDLLELDFPVALPSDGSIANVALIVALVDTTKDGFTSRSTFTIVRIAKVEGKQVLIKQTLVDHVVEGRGSVQDGNRVVSQTEDTIEFTKGESETWLFGRFGEILVFDFQVTNGEHILRDETFH